MNFELSEEQLALRDAVRSFLSVHDRASVPEGASEYDPAIWSAMATELGLHGIAIPEEFGGAGAGALELAVVLEEMGRVLHASPFFATVVLAAKALENSDDPGAQGAWLPRIAAGEIVGALAYLVSEGDRIEATPSGDGSWSVDGTARYVVDGDSADLVLVLAEAPGGSVLLAVESGAAGIARTVLPALDPTRRLADLHFEGAPAALVGAVGAGRSIVDRTLEFAAVALSAESVGVSQGALEIAVEHASSRSQFGRPIGSFQAVKHKLADMFIDVETSRTVYEHAAWSLDEGARNLEEVASLTLAHVADAGVRVAGQTLQILGGIGYTWEHRGHLHLKRARAVASLFGSSDAHRETVAVGLGL